MNEDDLLWAIAGGVLVWILRRKPPCPCSGPRASIAVGEPAPAATGGGCVGGIPTCR
jgi:hypothetical protein